MNIMSVALISIVLMSLTDATSIDIIANFSLAAEPNTTWTIVTGAPTLPIVISANATDSPCAHNSTYCWKINDEFDAHLTEPINTTNYSNVQFTFSVKVNNLNDTASCSIQYTLDGTTSNWQDMMTYDKKTASPQPFTETKTFDRWFGIADKNAAGIMLRIVSTGSYPGQECFFHDLQLESLNLTAEEETVPAPEYKLPKLEYQLTKEQKFEISHRDDPNEFVEEFAVERLPDELHREQVALRTIYHATNGVFWLKNWDFSVLSLCGQFGVKCTKEGRVTHLNLRANNLTGTVPKVFGELTYLIELDLSLNFLYGSIDFLLGVPLFFLSIRISHNRFSGQIPNELFQFWYRLQVFEAENNYLSGTIPYTFGWQRALLRFRISKNELEGSLPLQMGDPVSMQVFAAAHNGLTGTFPESLEMLSDDLQVLILSHNKLLSPFPSEVLNWFYYLKVLAVDHNRLFGEVGNLQDLWDLELMWLHNNMFDGNITNLLNATTNTRLQDLRLGGNYLDCEVYSDKALVHSDSPKDKAACVPKEYIDFLTGTPITVTEAIP